MCLLTLLLQDMQRRLTKILPILRKPYTSPCICYSVLTYGYRLDTYTAGSPQKELSVQNTGDEILHTRTEARYCQDRCGRGTHSQRRSDGVGACEEIRRR